MNYPFTQSEFEAAVNEWGCNCGPSALAFACQCSLDDARLAIPEFDAKRYTSPTMMKEALRLLWRPFDWVVKRQRFEEGHSAAEMVDASRVSLVRVQWAGPWTAPGMNLRWAYGYTHWVCTWQEEGYPPMVFDCNGGVRSWDSWAQDIVPVITNTIKRASGGWYPTHMAVLQPKESA